MSPRKRVLVNFQRRRSRDPGLWRLTLALSTYKAMNLRRKFDEKMKGNSKLLINEATLSFANCFVAF